MRIPGGLFFLFLALTVFAAGQTAPADFALEQQLRRAENFLAAGDYEKAALLLERYYPANKGSLRLYSILKIAYLGIKEYGKLENLIDEELGLFPKNNELRLDQIELFLRQAALAKADGAAKKFIESSPRDSLTCQNLAGRYLSAGYAEEAVEIYKQGRSELGKPLLFSYPLAETFRMLRRYREALEEYLKLLESDPGNGAVFSRTSGLIDEIMPDDANFENFMGKRLTQNPTPLNFRIKGDWEFRKGNVDAAIAAYEEADRRGKTEGLLLLELSRKISVSYPEKMAALAAGYEKLYPKSPDLYQILFLLARAQSALGQFLPARASYARIAATSPLPEDRSAALLKTARLFLENLALPDSALAYFGKVEKFANPLARQELAVKKGQALAALGNFEEARKTLLGPSGWNFGWAEQKDFLLAEWEFYFLNFDEAEKKYNALTDAYPRGERVNDALRRIALLKLMGKAKDSPLAVYAAILKDLAQFKENFAQEKITALEGTDPALAADALLSWGIYLVERQKIIEAVSAFEKIRTQYSQTAQAPLALEKLGELTELKKEPERAKSYYSELLENYPDAINVEGVRGKLRRLSERFPVKSP